MVSSSSGVSGSGAPSSSWGGASSGGATGSATDAIARAGRRADPALAPDDLHAQQLVLLLRSLVVDLAESIGVEPDEARDLRPEA